MAKLTNLDRSMAKVYARRIQRGEVTLQDVPERIRDLVASIINKQGPAGPYLLERLT